MTMDVYAQLEQRVDRSHGTAFDELVRSARGQEPDDVRDTFGTPDPKTPPIEPPAVAMEAKKKPANAGLSEVARPGLEPGTPRFSVVGRDVSRARLMPAIARVFTTESYEINVRTLHSFRAGLGTEMRVSA